MEDDIKLNAIRDLLRSQNISCYKETYIFLKDFLNKKIDENSFVDNQSISNMLGISKNKASKIISDLNKIKILKRSLTERKYYLPSYFDLKIKFMDLANNFINNFTENLSPLIGIKYKSTLYKFLNVIEGYLKVSELYNNTDLEDNIYYVTILSELACPKSFKDITPLNQKLIKKYFSKIGYNSWHQRYVYLKERLNKIIDHNIENGRIYYIIYLKKFFQMFNSENFKLEKDDKKNFILSIIDRIRFSLEELKEFIIKNKIFILIITEPHFYFIPMTIIGNHIFHILSEDIGNPFKFNILYIYNSELARHYIDSFLLLFKSSNIIKEYYKEVYSLPESIREKNLGKYLYNKCIEIIDKEIEYFENF